MKPQWRCQAIMHITVSGKKCKKCNQTTRKTTFQQTQLIPTAEPEVWTSSIPESNVRPSVWQLKLGLNWIMDQDNDPFVVKEKNQGATMAQSCVDLNMTDMLTLRELCMNERLQTSMDWSNEESDQIPHSNNNNDEVTHYHTLLLKVFVHASEYWGVLSFLWLYSVKPHHITICFMVCWGQHMGLTLKVMTFTSYCLTMLQRTFR